MKALSHLNRYLFKYRWRFLAGVFFVAISVVFRIYPAQLVRQSFDAIEQSFEAAPAGALDTGDLKSKLVLYGLAIIGSSLLAGMFMFFMRQTIIVMSRHIEYDLKNEIFDQYQKLSLGFYKTRSTGDLMNRISEDVSRVRMYIGPAIMYAVNVLITLVMVIAIMLSINVELTLYVLAPLPVLSYAIYKISVAINQRSERVQSKLSDLSTYVQEAFSGIRVLKVYVQEPRVSEEFSALSDEYRSVNEKLYKVDALFFPLMSLLIGLSTLATIYIGGLQTIAGEISAGNIAEFVLYVNLLTWPVASIGWVSSIVQRAEASQERINEFLREQPEIRNQGQPGPDPKGRIEFRNVGFTYPDSGIRALNDLCFVVEEGQTLAVLGKTGSGKSTLTALLGRLYDPTDGEIYLDGKPLREWDLGQLRRSLGFVPQDAFLFSETLRYNIAFGAHAATDEQIERAAKAAEIHDTILGFPEGYATRVGERGLSLSGGQKQRVSIARALVGDPALLVFDDCLSAVDTETESKILSNLLEISRDRSTLLISHRVSTVMHAHLIVVLDRGVVVERGTHDSLMSLGGVYADLYRRQLEEARTAVEDQTL
ncbi:ATP-binding cassette domain-containing protein [bacterium]|nr:ATP-binding cassette domain-containing protein [bacterium]